MLCKGRIINKKPLECVELALVGVHPYGVFFLLSPGWRSCLLPYYLLSHFLFASNHLHMTCFFLSTCLTRPTPIHCPSRSPLYTFNSHSQASLLCIALTLTVTQNLHREPPRSFSLFPRVGVVTDKFLRHTAFLRKRAEAGPCSSSCKMPTASVRDRGCW